jgi:hypothetical protein
LYILNAPNVLANPGTDVTLTGTLMAPVLEGLSTEFSWALLSKPPDSEASLSMLKQNTGILEEFPSSEVSFVPDVRGLYAFKVAVSINIANQPDVTIPPGRVSLTAADEFTETFETGALTGGTFFWHTGGNVPWEISDDYSHTGRYAARSGNIGDDQQSSIEIPIIVAEQAGISFSLRVSSEEGFDVLKFYIDDQLQDEWSGNIDWTSVSYTLSAGERRLKWQYEKDSSFSDGFDRAWIDDIFFPLSTTGVSTGSAIPTEYKLEDNYPNPFNPVTVIWFALPVSGSVNFKVYDILGREVAVLIDNDFYPAGRYDIPFDASNLPSGSYFYRIESGQFNQTRSMMLVR